MALLYPKTVSYLFLMSVHFPLKRYTSEHGAITYDGHIIF